MWSWSIAWPAPTSRSSGGRSAVSTISGTRASYASTTAGWRLAAAVPEVQVTATGLPLALASPRAMNPAARSSSTDTASIPSSAASVRISGALRDPGEVTAWVSPQRRSSSTNAWSGAKVRLTGMISLTMVLFVPGFMQRGDAWRGVAELLPQRYPSVLLEHREHTFEGRLAEIHDSGRDRVLVGYSLGGRLALRAALRDPSRYAGLVRVGGRAGIEGRAARRKADEKRAGGMERSPIEDIVGVWERQPLFADQPEPLIESQRAGRLWHEPADLAS